MKNRGKKKTTNEILRILYYSQDPRVLYGHIAFFKDTLSTTRSHKDSAPFVISEIVSGKTIVLGTVKGLLEDIQRLIREIREEITELNKILAPYPKETVGQGKHGLTARLPEGQHAEVAYFAFKQKITDRLILIACQARNLFDTFQRLRRTIPLYDEKGNTTSTVKIEVLFDQFVHSRYLHLDGEYVTDLFSSKPRAAAPISNKFLGYRFNWIEYVNAIEAAVGEVKIRDLVTLLRRRLGSLSSQTPHSDVVFLIQNLCSFSDLFQSVNPGKVQAFWDVLQQVFDEETKRRLDDLTKGLDEEVEMTVTFTAPRLAINRDLSKKSFDLHVKCRFTLRHLDGQIIHKDGNDIDLSKDVPYERLLAHIDQAFGQSFLTGFPS